MTAVQSIDTNVLIRAVLTQDTAQSRLARDLLSQPGRRFEVSALAWAELAHALSAHYGLSREQIAEMVTAIIGMDSIRARSDILPAALAFYQIHPKVSFEDCYMAETARQSGAVPLWTFDKKLASQHPAAQLLVSGGTSPPSAGTLDT